jgi:zinc and cadmium transporter
MKGTLITTGGLLGVYGVLVGLASLVGGWGLLGMRLTHARLQTAVSLVAGLMLGMALLHFIPEAVEKSEVPGEVMRWALAGFLAMFFLQRFLPYHHHDVVDEADGSGGGIGVPRRAQGPSWHLPEAACLAEGTAGNWSWLGTLLGMSLHSVMGGFALAAAVMAEAGQRGGGLVGLGTALVILLHKPFDAGAVSTVMAASGCSRSARRVMNGLFALVTPAGMLLFYLGASRVAHMNPVFLGGALAFCAGTFLCIACADLLPELQFHSHDRLRLSLALVAGLGIAILIGALEVAGQDFQNR